MPRSPSRSRTRCCRHEPRPCRPRATPLPQRRTARAAGATRLELVPHRAIHVCIPAAPQPAGHWSSSASDHNPPFYLVPTEKPGRLYVPTQVFEGGSLRADLSAGPQCSQTDPTVRSARAFIGSVHKSVSLTEGDPPERMVRGARTRHATHGTRGCASNPFVSRHACNRDVNGARAADGFSVTVLLRIRSLKGCKGSVSAVVLCGVAAAGITVVGSHRASPPVRLTDLDSTLLAKMNVIRRAHALTRLELSTELSLAADKHT